MSEQKKLSAPLHPPWLTPALQPLILLPAEGSIPLLPSASGTVRVYTYGSVISGCTGYGLVVVNSSGIVATCRGKLPNECSIFQAEGSDFRPQGSDLQPEVRGEHKRIDSALGRVFGSQHG